MKDIEVVHNSQLLIYRNPFGAVVAGSKVKICLDVNEEVTIKLKIIYFDGSVEIVDMVNDNSKYNNNIRYMCEFMTYDVGLIKYYFEILAKDKTLYYGNNQENMGGLGKVYYSDTLNYYQITVYKSSQVSSWFKNGIMYQIFVDRFNNGYENNILRDTKSNSFIYGKWTDRPMYIKDSDGRIIRWDFYGGNLEGVRDKLDYFKELGVTILYMNPIFESSSCHKYDVGDYEKVDSMFGDIEDFIKLCNEADRVGIKVILDGVFSHTGADSKYFNKFGNYNTVGAFQSKESKYYKWYRFKEFPIKYECWWGIDNQPNVEELEESYIAYIVKNKDAIVKKWIRLGASGWRLDVADELPDQFIKEIRASIKEEKKDSILIGEVWEDASNKISYEEQRHYLFGEELDSVTNYPLRDIIVCFLKGKTNAIQFERKFMSLYENYPLENLYSCMNLLGSHDTERILTALNNDFSLLKMAIVIQMTMPGVPVIYYGDEVGVTGGVDPDNRRTYPWGNENKEILNFYKSIINIRKQEECLVRGKIEFYESKKEEVLIYKRIFTNNEILLVVNNSNEEFVYNIDCKGIELIRKIKVNNLLKINKMDVVILKIDL